MLLGRLALFGATLFWGTSFVILKNALDSLGTLWILAMRFTIAALLLALFTNRRLRGLSRNSLIGSALIGLCLVSAYIVQTYGLKYTTPGKNAFLTVTYCVLVPFLVWVFYKRKPTAANLLAALLCITGIGFITLSGEGGSLNRGDILTLFSGFFYALQIILIEHYLGDCDALPMSTIEFATAAIVCWIGALLFEPTPESIPVSLWGSILYMGAVCTALCFFLQTWGIKATPSSTAAVILTFEAVFGAVFSVLFYHEVMTLKLFIGFLLVFLAVLLSETNPKLFRRKSVT